MELKIKGRPFRPSVTGFPKLAAHVRLTSAFVRMRSGIKPGLYSIKLISNPQLERCLLGYAENRNWPSGPTDGIKREPAEKMPSISLDWRHPSG